MKHYPVAMLRKVKAHIKCGGVIAYPTEYCYGLGCDPFNYKAVSTLIKLKRRNKNKGLIVIAGNIRQLRNLILPLNTNDYSKMIHYWPGFNTLILPAANRLIPANLLGEHRKIAVRVSKHYLVKQLCGFMCTSLVSTSANKSGCKPVKTYKECIRIFGAKTMVLPGVTNRMKRPSALIDWETGRVLR